MKNTHVVLSLLIWAFAVRSAESERALKANVIGSVEMKAGDPVDVVLRITNNLGSSIFINEKNNWHDYRIGATKVDGNKVPLTAFGAYMEKAKLGGSGAGTRLKAGEKAEYLIRLSLLYDLTEPGEYRFNIQRLGVQSDDDNKLIVVESVFVLKVLHYQPLSEKDVLEKLVQKSEK